MLPNPVSLVEGGKRGSRYVIFDAPNDLNVNVYGDVLHSKGVVLVIRTCEKTCSENYGFGIVVKECVYEDGGVPSSEQIKLWLRNVRYVLNNYPGKAIGVHCMAGLGRAPLLVAIALIEIEDYKYEDAVALIRKERRYAINQRQLTFLSGYSSYSSSGCCSIS